MRKVHLLKAIILRTYTGKMFNKRQKLIDVLKRAKQEKVAIGQFNFSSLEQLKGIALAAKELKTPVICGTSPGEANYFGFEEAVSITRALEEKEGVSLYLNYDHGKDIEAIKKAINTGYGMVHFDGSSLPLEENIAITKEVVKYAKKKGVVVEGEISKIEGSSSVSSEKIEEKPLTSIDKIVKFISETKADCIALDIGNVHGIHGGMPQLYPERINQLLDIISCFVVLHGGSGIKDNEIKSIIERGVVKININTESRVAWKNAIYSKMKEREKETTPYKILPFAVNDVYKVTKDKINLFNYAKNNL